MKNTSKPLFCSISSPMAEVVIRETKRQSRNEHELLVNVLVLSIRAVRVQVCAYPCERLHRCVEFLHVTESNSPKFGPISPV